MDLAHATYDQQILENIARSGKHVSIRTVAIAKIRNQDLLVKLALSDENLEIRFAALRGIQSDSILGAIAFDCGKYCDLTKRMQYFNNKFEKLMYDELYTTEGGAGECNIAIRTIAAGGLRDQAKLAKLAVDDKSPDVREAAVKNLTDQSILEKVVRQESDTVVKRIAVDRLESQALLENIAFTDTQYSVRNAAVAKIVSQPVLLRVIRSEKEDFIKALAFRKFLNKDSILQEIENSPPIARFMMIDLLPDSSRLIPRLAGRMDKLTDDARELLARYKMAKQEAYFAKKCAYTELVTDIWPTKQEYLGGGEKRGEAVIMNLGKDHKSILEEFWETRYLDFERNLAFRNAYVRSVDFFRKIINWDEFGTGIARLSKDEQYALLNSKIPDVRAAVIGRLDEPYLLVYAFVHASSPDIEEKVYFRLSELYIVKDLFRRLNLRKIQEIRGYNSIDSRKFIKLFLTAQLISEKEYNQIVLAQSEDPESRISSQYYEFVTDQPTLTTLALQRDWINGEVALEMVSDQECLHQIVQKSNYPQHRAIAMGKIVRQDILESIALDSSCTAEFRVLAVKKLMNTGILTRLGKSNILIIKQAALSRIEFLRKNSKK
ncbi:MAG: hypothetical protein LWX56_13860 [Ignavibacteria bacterium]|nr:hypothetical protein [Ignavibacteria bacterium]